MAERIPSRAPSAARSRRLWSILILLLIIPAGMLWRMAPLHLPPFAFKYGGSALWAAAVYWALAAMLPRCRPGRIGIGAAVLAAGVEAGKLVFWPPLDRFRETLAGKLLLGRYFSWGAVAAYWLAIAIVALCDKRFRPDVPRTGAPATQRREGR